MTFNKDDVKDQLEIEDINLLLEQLGAEPELYDDKIVAKTICHCGDSHKLYYYDNTRLFHCFTKCGDVFDVFDLVSRVKNIDLNASIFYIVNFFNLQHKINVVEDNSLNEDWKIFKRCKELDDLLEVSDEKIVLPEIDADILNNYPQPRYSNWEEEFIPKEICDYMNIRYNPISGGILIPHYDINGRMVGIRERTLIQENEKFGKYRPIKMRGKLRNHPLGFNLYGLNKAKARIEELGVAMVFESEKAVLQAMNYLGTKNNIAVSMCGSTLSNYQYHLLLDCHVREICIGIDRDFFEIGDSEYEKVVKKMEKMYRKYCPSCNISFMFDLQGLTGYKKSPTDCGDDVFMELWRTRFVPSC